MIRTPTRSITPKVSPRKQGGAMVVGVSATSCKIGPGVGFFNNHASNEGGALMFYSATTKGTAKIEIDTVFSGNTQNNKARGDSSAFLLGNNWDLDLTDGSLVKATSMLLPPCPKPIGKLGLCNRDYRTPFSIPKT